MSTARAEAIAGLYVHVPFCATRCTYCDFSTGSLSRAAVERYLQGMEREVRLRASSAAGVTFHSVFFGGGTPSALSPDAFARLWRALESHFTVAPGAEITVEANPESATDGRLEAWRARGVNRLSFGAQSFVPEELRLLGRVHAVDKPATALERARMLGFERLSLDLMFAFPGHTPENWRRTLARAVELDPGHLSAYCYIPEPGTPLGDAVLSGREAPPEDDAQADAYAELEATLAQAGYACYETSNFCRMNEEARHNLVYWLRRPYLGLGPAAHGLVDGRRYGNHYARERWWEALERGEAPESEVEQETDASRAREILMLGLRLACGLHAGDHPAPVWESLTRRYGEAFRRAIATGRLERCAGGVRIPASLRFLADDVIAWIDAASERPAFDTPGEGSIIPFQWHPSHSPAA